MKNLIKKLRLNTQQLLAVVVALLAITLSALGVVQLIEKRYQENLLESLQTISASLQDNIRTWEKDKHLIIKDLARQHYIQEAAQQLLDLPKNREALLSSSAQEQLRKEMTYIIESGQFQGYFLIAPDNINLASSRNSNIGISNLLTKFPQVLAKLWAEDFALTPIQESEIPLTTDNNLYPQAGDKTLFIASPVKNNADEVIALLTLRINPYNSLFPILLQGRIGQTGESYAFDYNGQMLSISRFEQQMLDMGLLQQGQSSVGNIHIREPEVTRTLAPDTAPETRPLTRMAASATQGEHGYDLNGYRDYRGIPVVGIWFWNETLKFGITVEQDMSEAYALFHFVRLLIYGGAIIAALILLALVMVFARGKQRLSQVQLRLQAIVETAIDAILVIDERGIIKNINPAVETMFGFPAQSLIGRNIKMLMPEPYHREHDSYLAHYRKTGQSRIIGIGRKLEAKRRDGTTFPIELAVNRLQLDSGLHFAGFIRDITEQKQAKQELQDERDFTRAVLDSLSANIAVLDGSGRIVMVNAAWQRFAEDNGMPAERSSGPGINYLHLVQQATGEHAQEAPTVAAHFLDMLAGKYDTFTLEYPCHSPQEKRWFQMRASHFMHHGQSAIVVSHINITKLIEFELQLKQLNKELQNERDIANNANKILNVTQQALDRTRIAEFWMNTSDGCVIRVNNQACRHLGYSQEELLHLCVPDFCPNYPTEKYAEMVALIKKQGWGRFESTHLSKDGQIIPVEITGLYLPESGNEQSILITFVVNISERKQDEAALIQAREEAEAANRAKSTFLATMSHEIRTPLNGVVGTVDMLTHTDLNPSQQALIAIAQDSALLLQGIIDDILDFSKIESGRLELELVPLNVESMVETLGESLQHLASKRDVELLLYCDPDIPQLKGDPVRLRQIIYNLAGNAIKFSGEQPDKNGQVIISVTKESLMNNNVSICLKVSDNGIGMSAEVQQRLFNSFVQGETETTRRFGGTGLGLVITKRLVELMGGHIELHSAEGKGAIFSVFLSLEQVSDIAIEESANLEDIKVYLLKSNDDATWIVKNYLQSAGAEVIRVTADNLLDIFRETSLQAIDHVVVFDTPGDDILAQPLRAALRLEAQGKKLHFLLLARGQRRYARKYDNDVMTLDFNAMRRISLLNTVAAITGRESPLQDKQIQTLTQIEAPHSIEEARANGQLILLADDNEINQEVISQQLYMLGFMAEVADDGKQALAMWHNGGYNLMMTDCHMPEMDGYQLAQAIRAEEQQGQHIPIIAITADAMEGAAHKCHASGMDDYLTKPIQLHQLQETLAKWLPFNFQKADSKTVEDPCTEDRYDSVDPNALGNLLGIQDAEILSDYYSDFLQSSEQTVEQIGIAYNKADLSELGNLAHKLKSSARTVGANRLADCCQELEQAGKKNDLQLVADHMDYFPSLYKQVKEWIEN